ncbi:AAA family ATPase [Streptomyces phaeofaciens]|uniref:AAA family ATPase n=1 Tax=Streptomyces phaeofaciens TaxID=68254 RepID=UPI00368A7E8E
MPDAGGGRGEGGPGSADGSHDEGRPGVTGGSHDEGGPGTADRAHDEGGPGKADGPGTPGRVGRDPDGTGAAATPGPGVPPAAAGSLRATAEFPARLPAEPDGGGVPGVASGGESPARGGAASRHGVNGPGDRPEGQRTLPLGGDDSAACAPRGAATADGVAQAGGPDRGGASGSAESGGGVGRGPAEGDGGMPGVPDAGPAPDGGVRYADGVGPRPDGVGGRAEIRDRVSRDVAARVAGVARRLAAVVERTCSPEAGAASAGFLREWAALALAQAPAARLTDTRLDRLARHHRLTPDEVDLLLFAGLPEEHEGLARTLRAMHPTGEPHPSVGLACLLLENTDRAALRRLLNDGAAVRTGILVLSGTGPFHERSLTVADRLWDALHGLPAWPAVLDPVDLGPPVAGLDVWLRLPESRRAVAALGSADPRVLLVTARDEAVALSRCAALAAAAGLGLVAARARPDDPQAMGLLGLHAVVRDSVPLLVAPHPAAGGAPVVPALGRLAGPLLVCAPPGAVRPGPERPVLTVPLGPVGVADRRAAWRAALPEAHRSAPELAARHPLDPALTAQVALDLRSRAALTPGDAEDADAWDVSAAIRARAGAQLPPGVDLVGPRARRPRLVLTDEADVQLRDAVARLRHQALVLDDWQLREAARASRGVRLLLTGPPGTGKSLAAEVLAAEAGRDLLVVDGSELVSKYIGETEKNLAACFEVAERTQAVFLLDEADALFGTRTEISEANDRFANMETAYLLQRLDRFDGLAVLTTNLRQNIDAAFIRRMDFVVEFPLPGEDGRHRMWDLHLPAPLLDPDVDLPALARSYPVPGGWIRNAAIGAAFRAADEGGTVRQRHLVQAMRREYAKAGRPFPGEPPQPHGTPFDGRAAQVLAAAALTTAPTQKESS